MSDLSLFLKVRFFIWHVKENRIGIVMWVVIGILE